MIDILNIIWDQGQMKIILDKFFPCSKKELKKLIAVISIDWEHEKEIKENLKVYFQEKKVEHEAVKKENARWHLEYKQKETDTKEIVETRKRPNGMSLSKDELKEEKERLAFYKTIAKNYLSQYKQHEKEEKQFSEYLKLL